MTNAFPRHPHIEIMSRMSLRANPSNARTHDDKQISQIATSIERFGFLVPIVVDAAGQIAAGHGRWMAAARLGLEQVPVIRVEFLTDADRRAFALAENRIAELSGWDDKLLASELSILFEDGYDLEITGFATSDLDLSLPDEKVTDETEQIELPNPTGVGVSRPGDLWHIGPHRLLCGDARKPECYERLLSGDLADMVFSDPPYGVKVQGHVSGQRHHREFAMMSGEQTPAELTAFFRAMFRNCVRFSAGGSIHYQCIDWRHIREMLDAGDGVYAAFKQLVVWTKNNGGQGSFYRSQHELICVFKAGKGPTINNFGLGATGRYRTNVWSYAGCNTFRKGRDQDIHDHPSVKPTALVADAIRDCSNRGDLILDPFSGSGTTLIAAHRTGRRGAAIELDPLYVDLSLRRLAAASGLEILHADGRRFDAVASERSAEASHD